MNQQPVPPVASAEDANLAAKIQQIRAAVTPKIKEAVAADPSKQETITRLLSTALKQEKEASFADSLASFTALVETVKDALGIVSDQVKYQVALPGAEHKAKTLQSHPQIKAITSEFGKIQGYLVKAKEYASKNKFGDGFKELVKLEKAYPALYEIVDLTDRRRRTEDTLKTDYNNLKQHQGKSVITDDLKTIETRLPLLDAYIRGRKWVDFRTLAADVFDDMEVFKRRANKHGDYVGLRNNSLAYIKSLEAHPSINAIKPDIASIKTELIEKAKVEYESNKDYEKARSLLVQVEGKCDAARTKADDGGQATFKKEFDAVAIKLKELEKPEKTNPIVKSEVTAIKVKLTTSEKYAGAKQFPESMKLLSEVSREIARTEKLAGQQVALNDAQKAAGDAITNIDSNTAAAVDAVQKLFEQVKKHPQAATIKSELAAIEKTVQQAKAALA